VSGEDAAEGLVLAEMELVAVPRQVTHVGVEASARRFVRFQRGGLEVAGHRGPHAVGADHDPATDLVRAICVTHVHPGDPAVLVPAYACHGRAGQESRAGVHGSVHQQLVEHLPTRRDEQVDAGPALDRAPVD
jgi:hypothetical protein